VWPRSNGRSERWGRWGDTGTACLAVESRKGYNGGPWLTFLYEQEKAMHQHWSRAAVLKRGLLGGFVGAIAGVVLLVAASQAISYYPPDDGTGPRLFLTAAAVAGTVGAPAGQQVFS
jgi:hypothetical protein